MKLLLKVFLATSTFLLVACEKQENTKQECLLHQIEWVNSVGTDSESSGYNTYTYDENNKISEVLFNYKSSVGEGIYSYDDEGRVTEVINMFQKKPFYKMELTWGNESVEVVHYKKNDNGKWVPSEFQYKKLYQLNAEGKVIKEEFYYIYTDVWEKSIYKIYEWRNGNVSKEMTYRISSSNMSTNSLVYSQNKLKETQGISSGDILLDSTIYTYDDKNNYNAFWGITTGVKGLNQNNILSSIQYFESIDTVKFEYEYND